MTAICIPIFINARTDIEDAVASAEAALAGTNGVGGEGGAGGMIELRCDTATPRQMLDALDATRLPAIVTIRPAWEGGHSQKSDRDRIHLWEAAMEAGADYIDVELVAWEKSRAIRDALGDTAAKHGTRLILSTHSFEGRPPASQFADRLARLRAVREAHILKIAWKAESIVDALRALELSSGSKEDGGRPMVALAMGEEGLLSRLLARKFGAPFTFAAAEIGKESAPGQPTAHDLRTIYRWEKQTADSPIFGVIGWPVGHSLSPHIHNAGFAALHLDQPAPIYVPLAIRPDYESFCIAVDALRASLQIEGVSITIPHKENALRYAREHQAQIDPLSTRIGALNTLLFPAQDTGRSAQHSLRGFNTDYAGALDALVTAWTGKRSDLAGKSIAVLGAGGAARAIVAGLAEHGANVVIFNRTPQKAAQLANDFASGPGQVTAAPWQDLANSHCDAYINCTPVGMHPNVNVSPLTPADMTHWTAHTVIFDTIYNPLKTKLLKLAEKKGAKTVPGIEMFIRQAALQFDAFTGKPAPIDLFRRVIEMALAKT